MTFSIVARDPLTGALGLATATAGPLVGALVPHVREGLGAIATQAMTNPYLALDMLDVLETQSAADAMDAALSADPERELRQAIVVDRSGRAAGWTGSACEPYAAHIVADGVAAAGNMLADDGVLVAMLSAYDALGDAGLSQKLLAALRAGAAQGGDKRVVGSAALKVCGAEAYPELDLRIDWSGTPIADLEQLFEMATTGSYADFFASVKRRQIT